MLITGSALHCTCSMYWSFKILFLVRFSPGADPEVEEGGGRDTDID